MLSTMPTYIDSIGLYGCGESGGTKEFAPGNSIVPSDCIFFIGESGDHLGSFLHLMEKAKTAPK